MVFPKGKKRPDMEKNNYWKIAVENGTIGNNKLYTPIELAKKINEWVEITLNSVWEREDFIKSGQEAGKKIYLETPTPFLIQDLCLFLKVNRNYLTDLNDSIKNKNDPESKEFSRIIAHIELLITNQKLQGATVGAYNPTIVSMLEGLRYKADVTSDGEPLSININVSSNNVKDILNKE